MRVLLQILLKMTVCALFEVFSLNQTSQDHWHTVTSACSHSQTDSQRTCGMGWCHFFGVACTARRQWQTARTPPCRLITDRPMMTTQWFETNSCKIAPKQKKIANIALHMEWTIPLSCDVACAAINSIMLEVAMVKPTLVIEWDALITHGMTGEFSLSDVWQVNVELKSSS